MAIQFNADEVFEIAMDIEANGEAFYDAAAQQAKRADAKAVFERLREAEKRHYATFKALREKLPPDAAIAAVHDPEGQISLYLKALSESRVFGNKEEARQLAGKVKDEIEALKIALQYEKDTIVFFHTMQEVTKAEWGKEQIGKLIAEEQTHVRDISAALAGLAAEP